MAPKDGRTHHALMQWVQVWLHRPESSEQTSPTAPLLGGQVGKGQLFVPSYTFLDGLVSVNEMPAGTTVVPQEMSTCSTRERGTQVKSSHLPLSITTTPPPTATIATGRRLVHQPYRGVHGPRVAVHIGGLHQHGGLVRVRSHGATHDTSGGVDGQPSRHAQGCVAGGGLASAL